MTSHVRAQIRAAAVQALMGLPTTADRVYSGRTRPLAQGHRPSLLIYAIEERSDTHAGSKLLRELTLAIEGRVVMADVPDDILDSIALEVEPALIRRPLLGGRALEVTLTATRITTEAPGENHVGEIRMEFRVQYRTDESDPSVAV